MRARARRPLQLRQLLLCAVLWTSAHQLCSTYHWCILPGAAAADDFLLAAGEGTYNPSLVLYR
jgi:hypothetical protein